METGLLQIQSKILREIRQAHGIQNEESDRPLDAVVRFGDGIPGIIPDKELNNCRTDDDPPQQDDLEDDLVCAAGSVHSTHTEIGRCFASRQP
jgi:hypothetical protein